MEGSEEVVVVATMRVLPGHVDRLVERFGEIVAATHREEGCLTYSLHRDRSDPLRFVLIERWRSQEDLDAHFQQPHMQAVAGLADGLAGPPEVILCGPVPQGDPAKRLGRSGR
jgi:quinol monooxygenase YgiN